jgi:hypothetical protein
MQTLRAFLLRHRLVAIVVVMAALCMKIALPTGLMIGQDTKVLTVQICDDAFGSHASKQIAIPMKADAGKQGNKASGGECPYAALSMASLSGADPALLALALAFILLLGFAPVRPAHRERAFYLRPPLRGPPALV